MPKVEQGQTAYGIVQSLGTTPEEFLKANPSFAGQGGKNDYLGLSGNIQVGQEYSIPGASTTPVPGSGTYAEDIAKTMNLEGGNAPEGTIANTSEAERSRIRNEEIEKIKKEISPATPPTVFKSAEEYKKLREEQGLVKDEEELAAIRQEADLGSQELRKFKATSGEAVPEAGRLGMMSEAERNLNFRLEGLALRENTVLNRINSKNAFISNMVNLGQQDYTNALNDYNAQYQVNSKAVELYNSQLSEDKKDAMTSYSTITNLLKDKNVDINTITPALKTQIQTLELQAGIPEGTFEALAQSYPEDKILSPMQVENADGSKSVYFFAQDSKTGEPKLIKTFGLGGGTGIGAGTGQTTYVEGQNPVVDSWVKNIESGQAKISSVPAKLKNAVSLALSQKAAQKSVDSGVMDKLNDVNSLLDNKAIPEITGSLEQFRPTWMASSEGNLAINLFDKIKNGISLENRNLLKGTGTISDYEAQMLSAASSALGRNLSTEEFKKQLYIIQGAFRTASGLSTNVKIIDPKTGESKEGMADRAMIDDAIASGYKVEYIK